MLALAASAQATGATQVLDALMLTKVVLPTAQHATLSAAGSAGVHVADCSQACLCGLSKCL